MLPTLRTENDKRPRFEYYPTNNPTLRTVFIDKLPFTVGRGEENELQINCTSVSRLHAELTKTSGGYLLRDLGSTNGTSVNGQGVSETVLQDGDAVRIADVELTFVCSSLGRLQRMVTQPLAMQKAERPDNGSCSRAVFAQRELNEALLWQAGPLRREAIIDLQFASPIAHATSLDEPLAASIHSPDFNLQCSALGRLQDLAWRMAAEGSRTSSRKSVTLLRIEQRGRLGEPAINAFQQAQSQADRTARLGVLLPWDWVTGQSSALEACKQLRALGAVIALDEFSGGAKCVEALEPCPPDYLALSQEVVREVATQQRRWQRLEIVQASCDAVGVRTVLPSGVSGADSQTCQALGIGLGVTTANKARARAPAAESVLG